MNVELLSDDLRRDEGLRMTAYLDGVGIWTLGYGHTAGVEAGMTCTLNQADEWLIEDIHVATSDLNSHAPWWYDMPEAAQRGLTNQCFNLGWPRLSGFKKMLAALEDGRYADAADEALDSKWATQVGARATRIADLFRSCERVENVNV